MDVTQPELLVSLLTALSHPPRKLSLKHCAGVNVSGRGVGGCGAECQTCLCVCACAEPTPERYLDL